MSQSRLFPVMQLSIAAIMLVQTAALLVRSGIQEKMIQLGTDPFLAKHFSYFVVPILTVMLLWPYLRNNWLGITALLRLRVSLTRLLIVSVLLGTTARLAWWSGVIANASFGWLGFAAAGEGQPLQLWFSCPSVPTLLLAIVVMSVLTPIGEEVIYRGLILGKLLVHYRATAILVSAMLFAILHQPTGMPAAFVIGILFALQTLTSQSLLPAILSHATYNLMAVIDWDCLHGIWNLENASPQTNQAGLIALVIGTILIVFAFWLSVRIRPGTTTSLRAR